MPFPQRHQASYANLRKNANCLFLLDTQAKSSYLCGMNKLPLAKRAQILTLLCEGSSMRSIERIVDCSINTVDKLLRDAGEAALAYHDAHAPALKATRVPSNTT